MLDFQVSTIVFTVINLLVLYFILRKLLFGRVNAVLEQRAARVKETIDSAEASKSQAEELRAEYEDKLTDARQEAAKLVADAQNRAQRAYEAKMADAETDAKRLRSEAEAQIASERDAMLRGARNEVASLALLAAAWVLAVRRLWQPLALGAEALRVDVVNTVSASLELGFTLEPALSLPEALWTNCATLLVLLALVPLGALLGLGVVRLRSFWLVFVSSFPFVLLPLCISVTPGWLPLMALVLGWVVPALTSLLARTSPLGAVRLNLAALPAAALLLAALSLAMPMDTYQRPAWADRALQHLTNQAVRLGDGLLEGSGPFGIGSGGPTPTAPSLSPTRGRCASPDAPCWRWRPTSLAASTCGGSPTRYMTARAGSRWMRRPTTGRPASAASHMERPSRWTWTLASLGLSPCSPSSSP